MSAGLDLPTNSRCRRSEPTHGRQVGPTISSGRHDVQRSVVPAPSITAAAGGQPGCGHRGVAAHAGDRLGHQCGARRSAVDRDPRARPRGPEPADVARAEAGRAALRVAARRGLAAPGYQTAGPIRGIGHRIHGDRAQRYRGIGWSTCTSPSMTRPDWPTSKSVGRSDNARVSSSSAARCDGLPVTASASAACSLTMATVIARVGLPVCAAAGRSVTKSRGRTRRGRTARPSVLSKRSYASGRIARPTSAPPREPPRCRATSATTTNSVPIRASVGDRRGLDFRRPPDEQRF